MTKYESVEVLYHHAVDYKGHGNDFFKEGSFTKAKKKYHCALLQTRAISSRDTVGRSMSFFDGSISSDLKYSEDIHFKEKVETLEADCNRNMAAIFIKEGNFSKGLEYSRKALDNNERDEKALYRYCTCALNLGQLSEAKDICDQLLNLNQNSTLYKQTQQTILSKIQVENTSQKKLYQNMFNGS